MIKEVYIGSRTKARHIEVSNEYYKIGWSHSGDWKNEGDFSTLEIYKDGERLFSFPVESIEQVELFNAMLKPLGFVLIDEPPRFRSEVGGVYFYVSAIGSVCKDIESSSSIDDKLFEIGNYFETYDEALNSKFRKIFEEMM